MWRRLLPLSLAEWRHHPWRHGVALLAVALGVALASSVQLINASALAEFGQAVRAVNGQPDAVLVASADGGRSGLGDAVLDGLLLDPAVAVASPVLALESVARRVESPAIAAASAATAQTAAASANFSSAPGTRSAVRVVGIDALNVAAMAPALMPQPTDNKTAARLSPLDPQAVTSTRRRCSDWTWPLPPGPRSSCKPPAAGIASLWRARWPRVAGRWWCWTLPPPKPPLTSQDA